MTRKGVLFHKEDGVRTVYPRHRAVLVKVLVSIDGCYSMRRFKKTSDNDTNLGKFPGDRSRGKRGVYSTVQCVHAAVLT